MLEYIAILGRNHCDRADGLHQQVCDEKRLVGQGHLPSLDLGEIQQVIDKAQQVVSRSFNLCHILLDLDETRLFGLVLDELAVEQDRI